MIQRTEDLQRVLPRLAQSRLLACDLETTGLDPHSHRPLLLSLGDDQFQIQVDCRKVSLEPLKSFLAGPALKVTHNGAFDLAMLRSVGVRVENVLDTMLIEQVINNGLSSGRKSLADLAIKYVGAELPKAQQKTFINFEGEFSNAQVEYARRDILATFWVLLEQLPKIEQRGLQAVTRLECQAVPAFADLHFDGVYLDRTEWMALMKDSKSARDQERQAIEQLLKDVVQVDLFGHLDLNLGSEAELKKALSELLGRPVKDLNKKALGSLGHPIAAHLLRYREKNKLVTTYGQSLLDAIHPNTFRLHAQFIQIGAMTGRVACRDPNLQNIPRDERFRRCFKAPDGYRIITADYSGCELRILAQASGDPSFVNTFRRGGDLHSIVASKIFAKAVSKKDHPELREKAKAINFGLAYGMGAGGLAGVTGLSLKEAEDLLKKYFAAFPQVRDYLEESSNFAIRQGWTATLSGRRLYLDVRSSSDLGAVSRVAKNMPIQGTNADMLKIAMCGIRKRLLDLNLDARMVNCVHDEVVLEAHRESTGQVVDLVREEMVSAGQRFIRTVPVEVDVQVGSCWLK
jgi:DNA polymerase I-like protein with 3'-5' exonuclease and polymerase domains